MELSTETKDYVIVTRLGDFWVNKEKAASVSKGLEDKSGKVMFEEFGTISMAQVFGVLNRQGYEAYQNKQNGKWQCDKKTWHDKFAKCDCRANTHKTVDQLNMAQDNREAPGEGYKKYLEMRKNLLK